MPGLCLEEGRAAIGPDGVALEYLLGESRSDVWVLTPDRLVHADLPGRAYDQAAAAAVLQALRPPTATARVVAAPPIAAATAVSERERRYWRAAGRLSDIILAPVIDALADRRIYLIADGALQMVPFGALPRPVTGFQGNPPASVPRASRPVPLIVSNEIVNLPSLSVLAMLHQTDRGRFRADRIALFADPVYDEDDRRLPRPAAVAAGGSGDQIDSSDLAAALASIRGNGRGSGGSAQRFGRLASTADEANAITALAAPGAVTRFDGPAATRQAALNQSMATYDVIHFATHGFLNDRQPELSGLVLSRFDAQGRSVDGFLRLVDVYGMKVSASLVVLSACESGLGTDVSGEGLIGLTRGFLLGRLGARPQLTVAGRRMGHHAADDAVLRRPARRGAVPRRASAGAIRLWQSERWRAPYYRAAFAMFGE